MEHLVPWFTLKSTPGVGNLLFRRLIDAFGTPERVLAASRQQLERVEGISSRLSAAIRRHKTPDGVYREIDQLEHSKFQVVTQNDETYPQLLLHIPDPPPLLYIYGRLERSPNPIAVVGSRMATAYGRSTTRQISAELVQLGMVIISGMARGVDTCAHQGALSAGGKTVAVLGSGLMRIYPPENRKLFEKIAESGAVLSEFALNARPEAAHFPQRNRIISGMSWGTLVVEAAQRSGSLITARLAAEQGREVFAIPGSIQAQTARGTHNLIQQGAKLVQSARDIVEELEPQMTRPCEISGSGSANEVSNDIDLTEKEAGLLEAMGPYPVHIDELARRLDESAGSVAASLSMLELKGVVVQETGKFFYRDRPSPGKSPTSD
jgi:DNA processing protein